MKGDAEALEKKISEPFLHLDIKKNIEAALVKLTEEKEDPPITNKIESAK